MNLDRIKNAVGHRVQLLPIAFSLDALGWRLPVDDDAWIIEAVTDEGVRIVNPRTDHFTLLGKDHIHHYTSNPDQTRNSGVPHGFFTLNIQLILQGPKVRIVPTFRPGEPQTPADPNIQERVVDLRFPSDSGLQERLAAEGYRIAWSRETDLARRLDLEGWALVIDKDRQGHPVTFRLKDRPVDQILIMRQADDVV